MADTSDTKKIVSIPGETGKKAEATVQLVESNDKPSGLELVSHLKVTKTSGPADLVQLAQQVQKADEFVRSTASSKLMLIAEQIQYLQQKARQVLEESARDADLHHAACNMVKKPGQIYYLYRRTSGQTYLSLLSPEEWGDKCPEYLGGYKLQFDMSWTPLKDVEKRDEQLDLIGRVIDNKTAILEASRMIEN